MIYKQDWATPQKVFKWLGNKLVKHTQNQPSNNRRPNFLEWFAFTQHIRRNVCNLLAFANVLVLSSHLGTKQTDLSLGHQFTKSQNISTNKWLSGLVFHFA